MLPNISWKCPGSHALVPGQINGTLWCLHQNEFSSTTTMGRRLFIRHPHGQPVDCRPAVGVGDQRDAHEHPTVGGIYVESERRFKPDTALIVTLSPRGERHEFLVRVAGSRLEGDIIYIALYLEDEADRFRVRIVEQLCYIEDYRQEVFREEGRELSAERAALEWISKYAARFPFV